MEGILKFLDYQVLSTIYKLNPLFDTENEEFTLNPIFEFSIDYPDQHFQTAFVNVGVSIGDEELLNNSFFVSATIRGVFALELPKQDSITEDIAKQFYHVNAVAILFPYLRSLISDLTSKGSETPVILPTINVIELMKDAQSINDN